MSIKPDNINDTDKKRVGIMIVRFIFAPFLILIPGWLLFFKLKILTYPELIMRFPKAFALLIGLFVAGIFLLVLALWDLKEIKRQQIKN